MNAGELSRQLSSQAQLRTGTFGDIVGGSVGRALSKSYSDLANGLGPLIDLVRPDESDDDTADAAATD